MNWPQHVKVKEVGPRDGLQNESVFVPTEHKIAWIDRLSSAGFDYIEVTSFVSPKWIPQLADAIQVARGITRKPGVIYAALVPNMRGLELALEAGVDEAAVFMSASETHNRKNINKPVADTFPILREVVNEARSAGKSVRGYVSTVFGCPYEGKVDIDRVVRVADELFAMEIGEISLGDTIGAANPRQVEAVLEQLLRRYPAERLALHYHDTRGTALANILVSMNMGITRFDASAGGLGGCPYAPGASGNMATEDLVYCLREMEIETGVDFEKLMDAARYIQEQIGRTLPSRNLLACPPQTTTEGDGP
ncbi:hydroxymethylglutaryl-CoA lyase [Paenibacillus hamazuiensis]|uniref:hydroxymethylglutaryl-CoA lyase n=1 Tax=Paenibacillus hamazuiensis TaxID=2936508 RepID=UPI00201022F3|nr:hydroxymethylglutaryl-CoA lyase [Paenibacillus hamazuiensis]